MKKAIDILQKLIGHYDEGIGEYGLMSVDDDERIESALKELKELMPSKETLAKTVKNSTLWEVGKDGHNALSEIVESIHKLITERLGE